MNEKILQRIEDLDVRRELGLLPRRLDMSRFDMSFERLVWNPEHQTLYNFTHPGHHTVLRPLMLDLSIDGLTIFNMYEHPYEACTYWDDGSFLVSPRSTPWATELDVRIVTFSKSVMSEEP